MTVKKLSTSAQRRNKGLAKRYDRIAFSSTVFNAYNAHRIAGVPCTCGCHNRIEHECLARGLKYEFLKNIWVYITLPEPRTAQFVHAMARTLDLHPNYTIHEPKQEDAFVEEVIEVINV